VLDAATIGDLAGRLHEAERTKTPMRQLSLQHPDMTVDDAYAVQRAWVDRKLGEGRRLIGHKVGLTSKVMQQSLGIDEPDHGALLDDMRFDSGGEVPFDRFIKPRVEIELAFVLAGDLRGPGVTAGDVLAATAYVTPAMEILDARVQMTDPETGHTRTIVDTISDNAADAGIVLGDIQVKVDEIDLRWVPGLLLQNGAIVESGVSAAVLDHPANAVAWLANRLGPLGVTLEAGQVVLAGSFIRAVSVERGDELRADYGTVGSITCRFA
jgi:2-oxo-hept-3-ene-1,7-dioate hydratase